MARRLILLRHGLTEYNSTGRMQGQLDTALHEMGIRQAAATAEEFATWDIRRVITSDLTRASDTADLIAQRHGLTPIHDARLRETHLGEWQARSHEEIDSAHPGHRALWRHDPTWAPPGGETRMDVAARARAVIDEHMRTFPEWEGGIVMVVAHGGTIAALTAALLDLPMASYPIFSGLGNTSWAQLTARPRYNPDTAQGVVPSTEFDATTVADAQWYLDVWNASAIGVPFSPPGDSTNPDEIEMTYSVTSGGTEVQ